MAGVISIRGQGSVLKMFYEKFLEDGNIKIFKRFSDAHIELKLSFFTGFGIYLNLQIFVVSWKLFYM